MDLARLLVRARGVDALIDPEVAGALHLTEEQRQRMRVGRKLNSAARKSCVREWQKGDRAGGIGILLLAIKRQSDEHLLCILNAKQRRQFERMRSLAVVSLPVDGVALRQSALSPQSH